MESLSQGKSRIRKKAVWGRSLVIGLMAVLLASDSAEAQKRSAQAQDKSRSNTVRLHPKLDSTLNALADGNGESDVIVEFFDDSDTVSRIRSNGGLAGRKLGIISARGARMPNSMLKRLADDPKVKRVVHDREAWGEIARTTATIGARNVHNYFGYTGHGVGVAVIDSGITPWHDDLTIANRQGQRVAKFVDFVNGQTAKYDDWGHGTHVAGIIAGNGYD